MRLGGEGGARRFLQAQLLCIILNQVLSMEQCRSLAKNAGIDRIGRRPLVDGALWAQWLAIHMKSSQVNGPSCLQAPRVFVGCPYGGRFRFTSFQSALNRCRLGGTTRILACRQAFAWYPHDIHQGGRLLYLRYLAVEP